MTTHPGDELLAEWAMEDGALDEQATAHLRSCAVCSATVAELRATLHAARGAQPLQTPPADLWARIGDELSLDPDGSGRPAEPAGQRTADRGEGPDRLAAFRRFRGRTLAVAAAVAAVAGAGIGVGGTVLLTDRGEATSVEAVIGLDPLTGKSGTGSADLVRTPAGEQLEVAASGLAPTSGFYQVWLINVDGRRMISLGVLDPGTGQTFPVPQRVTAAGYRIVDVSLEPVDGDPAHSTDSVIRGTLPE